METHKESKYLIKFSQEISRKLIFISFAINTHTVLEEDIMVLQFKKKKIIFFSLSLGLECNRLVFLFFFMFGFSRNLDVMEISYLCLNSEGF